MNRSIKFIKASAGSGKTTELMRRIAELVTDKDEHGKIVLDESDSPVATIEPSQILATTFTVKAADELKSRVRERLLSLGDPSFAEKAQDVLDGLIGTVDSVCGRLLEEYSFEAGMSPSMQVIPEEYVEDIFANAVDGVFAEVADEIEPYALRLDMSPKEKKNEFDHHTSWKDLVKKIAEGARSNGIAPDGLEESCKASIAAAERIFSPQAGSDWTIEGFRRVMAGKRELFTRVRNCVQYSGFSQKFIGNCSYFLELAERPVWKSLIEAKSYDNFATNSARAMAKRTEDAEALLAFLRTIPATLPENILGCGDLHDDVISFIKLVFRAAGKALVSYQEYKLEHGLIDFVDQETKVLELFEHSESFRNAFAERVKVVMVDEFQDTSPLQLRLFLKMHEIVGNSIWVGDPKQSIYGFRGSDPVLMAEVAHKVEELDGGRGRNIKRLEHSWRSRDNLVKFVNALFVPAFAIDGMSKEDVELHVPPADDKPEEQSAGGEVTCWTLGGDDPSERLVDLIVKFAEESKGKYSLGQIALLSRSNTECDALAEKLVVRGLPISRSAGYLSEQMECQLAMAAYRYAVNREDTVALATLATHFLDPEKWVESLSMCKKAAIDKWNNDPRMKALGEIGNRTPREMLDRAIATFGIDVWAANSPNADARLRNLDELRAVCSRFMNESAMSGRPATPVGFIAYYNDMYDKCASANGGDCLQVLTYHQSKGLEWPVVILNSLGHKPYNDIFGLTTIPAAQFNIEDPLADRRLRFVPNPLQSLKKAAQENYFSEHSKGYCDFIEEVNVGEYAEMRRLMYVGMTRAIDRMILVAPYNVAPQGITFSTAWIDCLSRGAMALPWNTSDFSIPVDGGNLTIRVENIDSPLQDSTWNNGQTGYAEGADYQFEAHAQAKVSPSSLEGSDSRGTMGAMMPLSDKLSLKSDACSSDLGECVHSYMAVAVPGPDDMALAGGLISRWGVADVLSPDELVAAGARLREWINRTLTPKAIHTEVPMHFRHPNGQVSEGFIDMLVEKGDGSFVIIDHKVINDHSAGTCVKDYAPQQEIYRKAVQEVCGPVHHVYLHLPIQGKMVEIAYEPD